MNANPALFPGRETIASKLTSLEEADKALIVAALEKGEQDDLFLEGLQLYLDQQSKARFLNSLKLSQTGEWLGSIAPNRLQVRIMEAARSSQHAAYAAFREGLSKSGGMDRAFPPSPI
ncbi:hypothetical protein [Rhizobium sp. L1K21]|uniref:hypothetical protein n=1 Tax=Rhizobium sp. L1K21 TaxID=2954933 RepID=UPI0020930585|nr:hypothetical protein [Rhizobium sp. L1K21]MCO6185782.1 hypothetical protein [Rhizobium sp. L1K21]